MADRFRPAPSPSRHRRCPTGGSRASRPTSTWCATASPASTCSTTGCASSRAAAARWRGADRAHRPPADRAAAAPRTPADPRAALRPGGPGGRSSSSTAGSAPRPVPGRRVPRRPGITTPLQPVDGSAVAGARPPTRRRRRPMAPAGASPPTRSWRRRSRPTRSTCRWWSSSTTCGARPARTLHSLAPTRRASRTSTTRSSSSRTAPTTTRGWARSSSAASGPSSATSTSATRPRRRRWSRSTGASESSRGRTLALMIDGAHVLTPGVLRFGLQGLATYAPAIVATQQWYVGPGQQGDAMDDGYDQALRGPAVRRIEWPSDGYRLFEIGHFIGDRDWLDGGVGEQLPVRARGAARAGRRVRRALLDAGRRLRQPRAVRAAGVVARRHGVHDPRRGLVPPGPRRHDHQPVRGRGAPAAGVRLRPALRAAAGPGVPGAGKPIHFVGRIADGAARRTKPRRLSDGVFGEAAEAIDGRPERPPPCPTTCAGRSPTPCGATSRGAAPRGWASRSARHRPTCWPTRRS